jgi:predicted molibdopterin-dependent oxidoreductase YjgC
MKSDRIVPTTCPYCGVGCKLELHIKDDYIFRVTSPADNPVNQGNLCVKGRFGYDFLDHPDRVTTPLIRKTPQRAGERTQAFDRAEWREASWDEALNTVADRLVEIYKRDGPEAMAVYCCAKATNEDNYLLQKMWRSLFRTNNVDHCTRLCHAGSVVALLQSLGTSAMSNTASEVIKTDCFIVTGSNTTENHRAANERGDRKARLKADRDRPAPHRVVRLCDAVAAAQAGHQRAGVQRAGACDRQRKTLQPELYQRAHRGF